MASVAVAAFAARLMACDIQGDDADGEGYPNIDEYLNMLAKDDVRYETLFNSSRQLPAPNCGLWLNGTAMSAVGIRRDPHWPASVNQVEGIRKRI